MLLVLAELAGRAKLAEFMANHIFSNKYRYVYATVVHYKSEPDHLWRDRTVLGIG